ncbi:hypothetical protein [Nocardioides sp. WS12]|uniref:hypothetical protein n=1 Tax=Nocardioides sp. WS12 TaxID=2486272 RepID=UPI0015FB2FF1|nr:hypothetical protein [Nocardioides sp. WS12]
MTTSTKNTVIHTVTARETGAKIEIIQLGKPEGENKWAASCEHGARTGTKTRRAAHEAGRTPSVWCATCKTGNSPAPVVPAKKTAAKKAAPAPAKRAAAKKVTPAKPAAKRTPAKKTAVKA